ncbi:hypothetical protein CHS0354_008098 [Potamilus streckersoni]|uniref:Uncharacterized protein n=1 Tax=Potamilus streckersoni TaxID=2493646 RepID=A0AAE0W3R7_9BIVA|nr:hypothetical protein CHS0354_008098 [Potamilus streckersoni]
MGSYASICSKITAEEEKANDFKNEADLYFDKLEASPLKCKRNCDEKDLKLFHSAIINNNINQFKRILRKIDHVDDFFNWCTSQSNGSKHKINWKLRMPPLHLACMYRRPEMVDLLLQYGANPYQKDKFGRYPFTFLLLCWPRLQFGPEELDKVELNGAFFGDTAEIYFRNHIQKQHERTRACMAHFLDYKIDPSMVVNDSHQTMLHVCAKYNIVAALQFLVNCGGDVEKTNSEGQTPLILACKLSKPDCIYYLIQIQAKLDTRDNYGRIGLHYAALSNRLNGNVLIALIRSGSDVNARDNEGLTPLHFAVMFGQTLKVAVLLDEGADPDAKNRKGRSPLYILFNRNSTTGILCAVHLLAESVYLSVHNKEREIPCGLRANGIYNSLANTLIDMSCNAPSLSYLCLQRIRRLLGINKPYSKQIVNLECPLMIKSLILNYKWNARSEWLCRLKKVLYHHNP